jgi:predicted DsbA family dithiol-disulfide isomerase
MAQPKPVTVTYYLDVTSSWCFWSEPTWIELREQYHEAVHFEWKIAAIDPETYTTRAAQEWFYRRSGTITRSPVVLSAAWMEPVGLGSYDVPNRVAQAAKAMGKTDDSVRLAIAQAGLIEGRRIREMDVAIDIAAVVSGLDRRQLRVIALSDEITNALEESREEFDSFQVDQRPGFLLVDEIGDRAFFSGLIHYEPLAATIDAMLSDVAGYKSFAAHFGAPP